METLIARPGRTSRAFLPLEAITASPAGEATGPAGESQLASRIVALADRPFSPLQRLLGWGLDAPGRFGRGLWLHREAIRAEAEGRWTRADFFWEESERILLALLETPTAWEAVLRSTGLVEEQLDPEVAKTWKRRFIVEFLIDSHCAFYNGRMNAVGVPGADDRAFAHLHFLIKMIPRAELSRIDVLAIIGPPSEILAVALERAKRRGKAVGAIERSLALVPDHVPFQDRIILIRAREDGARLKCREGPLGNLADARALLRSERRAKRLLGRFPRNATAYETLGHLYHLRAVKLLNGLAPSQAMLSIEQSLAYFPGLGAAERTREEIRAMLEAMNARYSQLRASWARWFRGKQLDAEWKYLKSELSQGDAARKYAASAEARRATAGYRTAQAYQILGTIGLPTSGGIDDETARALAAALSRVTQMPPEDPERIAASWEAATASDVLLSTIDPAPVRDFLRQRLFPEVVADAARCDGAATAAKEPPGDPVSLVVPACLTSRGGDAPFGLWLFSRQGGWLKLQATAAVILVALGTTLTRRADIRRQDQARIEVARREEQTTRIRLAAEARQAAIGQLDLADARGNPLEVIRAAEAYLAAPAPKAGDPRDRRVLDLYDQAIVRWFIRSEPALDEESRSRIERYRVMTAAAKKGGR